MADVPEAPAPEQDQPIDAPEAPETDQPTGGDEESSFEDFDFSQIPADADREWFEERVKHFQSDYTRKTQAAAEERRAAEEEREKFLAQFQGNTDEPEDEEFDGEYLDPNEQRLARIEQAQAEFAQAQAESSFKAEFEDRLGQIEEDEGRELTPKERTALLKNVRHDIELTGESDPFEAWSELKELYSEDRRRWVETKKAPRKASNGTPATQAADLTNKDTRLQRMAEAAEAASQDT